MKNNGLDTELTLPEQAQQLTLLAIRLKKQIFKMEELNVLAIDTDYFCERVMMMCGEVVDSWGVAKPVATGFECQHTTYDIDAQSGASYCAQCGKSKLEINRERG